MTPPLPSPHTETSTTFSREESERYIRHFMLPEMGEAGQQKLKKARILLVGAGGLGSPVALYLAAAGVGELGIVDFDRVDRTNLQRQVLHRTDRIGDLKIDSARTTLHDVNPHVHIATYNERLSAANAETRLSQYDLVVDGTDNLPSRYAINDAAMRVGIPYIYGSIFQFEGQVAVFPPGGPCYRCLYPEPPPSEWVPGCTQGGVWGVVPGVIGTLQATEAIKWITGIGDPLIGRLLLFNAQRMQFREMTFYRQSTCTCGVQTAH